MNMRTRGALISASYLVMSVAWAAAPGQTKENQTMTDSAAADRQAILDHIHRIFKAYLRRDREEIRRLHTSDWTGFQNPSVKIERGIDAYMANAEKSLQQLRGTSYEPLDTEVQLHGDLALVYYVARFDCRDADGRAGSRPLRAVDIYRREAGGWNQSGSHITVIPQTGGWGEGGLAKPSHAANAQ